MACNQLNVAFGNLNMLKAEADNRLYQNMIKAGALEFIAQEYYDFVSDFGGSFWQEAQKRAKIVRGNDLKKKPCPVRNN